MIEVSRQARTWATFFFLNPDLKINYLTLMSEGKISRRKSLDILRELRSSGMVKAKKSRHIGTVLELTTKALELTNLASSVSSATAVQLVSAISNSYTARTTIKATNKFLDEVEGKEKEMGYPYFESTSSSDDEFIRERQKHEAKKKAEYAEAREKKAEKRKDNHRSKIDPINWTCKDVAFEFADRLADLWSIAPFSVVQSRFVPALSSFRKQQDTNGAIELEMIEMFFSSLEAEKYTDGNHLWRAFLHKATNMVQTARERIVTPEQIETAIIKDQELTNRKLSLLEDEDV
jgi:hypothetical protein